MPPQGALYGIHGGYNWQFGRAVTGFELDFNRTDLKGNNGTSETAFRGVILDTETAAQRESIQYLGSARARLGWLPRDNWLLYATAGLAFGRFDSAFDDAGVFNAATFFESLRDPITKFGWVAGLGTEVMLGSPNWIGRVEYLHYQFSALVGADTFSGVSLNRTASTGDQTVDVVRAGVSYRFADPAQPVPALYTKAPVVAPSASWAGFYLGVHGGYAWVDDPTTQPVATFFGDGTDVVSGTKYDGWVAGGHFGYNWQYEPRRHRFRSRSQRRQSQGRDQCRQIRSREPVVRREGALSRHAARSPRLATDQQRSALRHGGARMGAF